MQQRTTGDANLGEPVTTSNTVHMNALEFWYRELLKQGQRTREGTNPTLVAEAEAFLVRAVAAGRFLTCESDRQRAQDMIDTWTAAIRVRTRNWDRHQRLKLAAATR